MRTPMQRELKNFIHNTLGLNKEHIRTEAEATDLPQMTRVVSRGKTL